MLGISASGRRAGWRGIGPAAAVLAAALVAGLLGPAAAGAQEVPTTVPPNPQATADRLVDTPDGDPVLDDVPLVPDAAMRRTDDAFAERGRVEALRAIAWQDKEGRRLATLQASFAANQRVADADAALTAARADLLREQQVLAARQRTETRLRRLLAVQQAELRRLAAAVVAASELDAFLEVGAVGEATDAQRRAVVARRGLDAQTTRVEARRRPWASARRVRRAQDRRVAAATRTLQRTTAARRRAVELRDHATEILAAASAEADQFRQRLEAAHLQTAAARLDRRKARLLAEVEGIGMPLVALHAYWRASGAAPCKVPWWLLAGVGRVESRHGTAQGSRLLVDGTTSNRILGIPLDGRPGTFPVRDTDGGRLDGDGAWDRAVGPMQFLPGTWGRWATDDNGDGVADPHNLYDAAGAAAAYLCYRHGDLLDEPAQHVALFSYNRSGPYGDEVIAYGHQFHDALPKLPDLGPAPESADGAAATSGDGARGGPTGN